MNRTIVFILGLLAGTLISLTAAYIHSGRLLLREAYLSTANDVNNGIAVLAELRRGNLDQARYYLTEYLEFDKAVLEGCENDLCAKQSIPQVAKALENVKVYESGYEQNP